VPSSKILSGSGTLVARDLAEDRQSEQSAAGGADVPSVFDGARDDVHFRNVPVSEIASPEGGVVRVEIQHEQSTAVARRA
jgi:hypothetical protein